MGTVLVVTGLGSVTLGTQRHHVGVGDWSTIGTWSATDGGAALTEGDPPGAADTAIFTGDPEAITVTVDGADSSWTNNGNLYIGVSGSGTLTVQNGGSVSSGASWLGYDSSGTAEHHERWNSDDTRYR